MSSGGAATSDRGGNLSPKPTGPRLQRQEDLGHRRPGRRRHHHQQPGRARCRHHRLHQQLRQAIVPRLPGQDLAEDPGNLVTELQRLARDAAIAGRSKIETRIGAVAGPDLVTGQA